MEWKLGHYSETTEMDKVAIVEVKCHIPTAGVSVLL